MSRFITAFIALTSVCLLVRFLNLKLGSRVEPSAKKAIVITGATSGIGLSVAKRFYKKGFSVFATYYNDKEVGYSELKQLGDQSQTGDPNDKPKLFLVQMDVRSKEAIDEAGGQIEKLLDENALELFCLVCNAGISADCSFELTTVDGAVNTIDTNYTGTVLVSKRFLARIIRDKGRVLLTSSGTYKLVVPLAPVYASTKASVASLAASMNKCLESYGASCRCICPGDLIGKSNVILPCAAFFESAIGKLTPDERATYKRAIDEGSKILAMYLRKVHQRPDMSKVDSTETSNPRKSANYKPSFSSRCKTLLINMFLGGYVHTNCTLDETSALEAYDDAICVKNAPARLYPGNRIFQHITGPLHFEYYSQVGLEFMHLMALNLMKR